MLNLPFLVYDVDRHAQQLNVPFVLTIILKQSGNTVTLMPVKPKKSGLFTAKPHTV